MYSGADAIKLLRTELPRLSPDVSVRYEFMLPRSKISTSGVAQGQAEIGKLVKSLQEISPDRVFLHVLLF